MTQTQTKSDTAQETRRGERLRPKLLLGWQRQLDARPIPTLAALSAATELFIELLGQRGPAGALGFIADSPLMFLLNAAIIFSTLMFAILLRRKVFYTALVTLIWMLFGIVNLALLTIRATPFSARDFSILASGILIADVYFSAAELILMGAGLAALIGFVLFLYLRTPRDEKLPNRKKAWLTVTSLTAVLLLVVLLGTRHIDLSRQYESINEAFEDRGFPFCFATSIFTGGVDRPESYSRESVDDFSGESALAAERRPNIILVQLESFFDPALIRGVTLSEDPIPNFTALRDSCASGYLRMPTLGAGTVNAEFEVLTGMSLDHFGFNEYPYESVLRESSCESIAYYLRELGYGTHAIHNYAGSFYGRNRVYPNLGFDDFTSVEYMNGVSFTETGWPKDAVLTEYILKAMEKTETPDFVFAVTVQCHGKYPEDGGNGGIRFLQNDVFEDADGNAFLYFASQLRETDRFLGELIAALKDCGEETVVVAYGDHLPTLALTEEDMAGGSLYQTQYFIWSNYGPGPGGEDADLPAYRLTTRLLDAVGIRGGVIADYHREHAALPDYQEGLAVLEYDLLYGDRLAYGGAGPYRKTDMKMGLEEIVVNDFVIRENGLEIIGSGFTESSVIYISGRRCEDTVFISPNRLLLPFSPRQFQMEDKVQVSQTGEDRIILSTATLLS